MSSKITLLYSCDTRHSRASLFLHGAFNTRAKAINSLKELIQDASGYPPLSEEQLDLLRRIDQTQGYEGPGEFLLQTLELDTPVFSL